MLALRSAILFGARSPLYRDDLARWRGRFDCRLDAIVDRADENWFGNVGVITKLLAGVPLSPDTAVFICGPEIMMRFAVRELELTRTVDIVYFMEATSRAEPGPYDLSIVDGSITTADDAERIREIRAQSKKLVTIGACATAGGIQALRNFRDHSEMMSIVYARPEYIDSLRTSTPISKHVRVDYELWGCPISKQQLLEVLSAMLQGRKPAVQSYATCLECKMQQHVCVVVAKGMPCLGPVTHDGCGALCPGYSRGCYGCFGPSDAPQTKALARYYLAKGVRPERMKRMFSTFNAAAEPFREEAERHDDVDDAAPPPSRRKRS